MDPTGRPFAWLGVVASVTGILGFLAQIGLAPIFDPLKAAIPVPLWLGLIVVIGLLWLGVISGAKPMNHLLERVVKLQTELQSSRETIQNGEAEKKALEQQVARLMSSNAERDATAARKGLVEYEALEREIIGLLASGAEMSLSQIIDQTSVSLRPDRTERVTRAIAALGDKIDGSGGTFPKYKLVR